MWCDLHSFIARDSALIKKDMFSPLWRNFLKIKICHICVYVYVCACVCFQRLPSVSYKRIWDKSLCNLSQICLLGGNISRFPQRCIFYAGATCLIATIIILKIIIANSKQQTFLNAYYSQCPLVKVLQEHTCSWICWIYYLCIKGPCTPWGSMEHLSRKVLERMCF